MSKIGYTIVQAASAAGVPVRTVEIALKGRQLRARRIDDQPVILRDDIAEWLTSFPTWA